MLARQSVRAATLATRVQSQAIAKRNITSLTEKVYGLTDKTVYYSKVAVELAKQVYVKEGLNPPTVAEFTKVYECGVKLLVDFSKNPKGFADLVAKNAQGFKKDEILRYICYFIQVVGFFSLGEIVGRRHVVGYSEH